MVEDENGNIVRETMKDTDTLARYKTMHETLVYLSHLDHDDTESQMLEKLRLQVIVAGKPSHAFPVLDRQWAGAREPGRVSRGAPCCCQPHASERRICAYLVVLHLIQEAADPGPCTA